jgi:hypothetical protein
MRIDGDSHGAEFLQPESAQAELFDQAVPAGFEPLGDAIAEQRRGAARLRSQTSPRPPSAFIRFTTKETDTPKWAAALCRE